MEVKEQVLAGAPEDRRLRYDLARAYYNLGEAQILSGDLVGARQAFDTDLAIKRELLGLDPTNATWRNTYLNSLISRASVLSSLGEPDSAWVHLKELESLLTEMRRGDPVNRDWRRSEAIGRIRQADILVGRGAPGAARPLVDAAVAAMEALVASDSRAQDRSDLAQTRIVEGRLLLRQGDAERALGSAGVALTLLAEGSAGGDARSMARNRLLGLVIEGRALAALGRSVEAQARWTMIAERAAPMLEQGREPAVLAAAAEARLARGDRAGAEPLLARLRSTSFRETGFVQRLRELGVTY
jgi:tetratricopeptide (TPR) repeat protein